MCRRGGAQYATGGGADDRGPSEDRSSVLGRGGCVGRRRDGDVVVGDKGVGTRPHAALSRSGTAQRFDGDVFVFVVFFSFSFFCFWFFFSFK